MNIYIYTYVYIYIYVYIYMYIYMYILYMSFMYQRGEALSITVRAVTLAPLARTLRQRSDSIQNTG